MSFLSVLSVRADAGLLEDKDLRRAELASAGNSAQSSRPQTTEELAVQRKKEKVI